MWYGKKGLWHPMTRDIFSAFFWLLILRLGLANGNPWYPWCWHVVVEFVVMGWLWCFSLEKSWDPPGDLDNFDGTETNNPNTQRFYMYSFWGFPAKWTYKKHIFRHVPKLFLKEIGFPRCVFVFPRAPRSFSHFPQWRRCDQRLERLCLESLHRTWMLGGYDDVGRYPPLN